MNKKNNILLKIWPLITTIIVIAAMACAMALVGVRLFGLKPYAIISPSMTSDKNNYNVGDLVYVKKYDPDKIKVNDVITFVVNEEGTVATHRVVEIDKSNRCFYTKGDANQNRDGSPVFYDNLVGKVVFSLPKLGYVSSYVTSESGKYICIAALIVLVILMIIPEFFKSDKKNKQS